MPNLEFRRVGLARALSKLGVCSRTQAARMIRAGKVLVNGALRRDPEYPVRPDTDRIEISGRAVAAPERIYLMLNKPRGIVTTASDEKGRDTVYKFLTAGLPWIAPVGRLDKASEGLLILTNDSEWAARITAPETHLEKIYHVQIGRIADALLLESLKRGVRTRDGDLLRVRDAKLIRKGERNSWLEIILEEGKNRQIRRLLEAFGVEVLRLIRVAIGPLALGNLPKGVVRALLPEEKLSLDRAMEIRTRKLPQREQGTLSEEDPR